MSTQVSTQEAVANPQVENASAAAKPNSFLKPVSVTQQAESVQLEKPRPVLIAGGDITALTETLRAIKNEKGADFNACVMIVPLYDGMKSETVTRTRQKKRVKLDADGKPVLDVDGKEVEEVYGTEEYESLRKFADTSRINLTAQFGLAIDVERPMFAGITVYDRPKKEPATGGSSTGEPSEESEESETETE